MVAALRARQEHIPAHSWLSAYHHILVEGWELFAQSGGSFAFPDLTAQLLADRLADGPYLVMVNSTYLNREAKHRYDHELDKFVPDATRGRSLTHAVTCTGYRDERFLILDPDPPKGTPQRRWIGRDHLLVSIMAAQTESDNLLLTAVGPA